MQVNPASRAAGYRASKVIGSTVVDDANVNVGTIDDLIITATDKVPFAVLSVREFFSIGTQYVVVKFGAVNEKNKQLMLSNTTKGTLIALWAFK